MALVKQLFSNFSYAYINYKGMFIYIYTYIYDTLSLEHCVVTLNIKFYKNHTSHICKYRFLI